MSNKKDIDTVTDEDIAYWKSMDFSKGKRANEIPLIKALQSNPKARAMYAPRKAVHTKIDADILAWLKNGGRCYQERLNAILRKEMNRSLAH